VSARAGRARGVSWAAVRKLFLSLPGVTEGISYRTPAFHVDRKLLARLREDGENLVVRIGLEERETLMAADPETFHITDHYLGHPWVLVRLARVHRGDLRRLAEQAWRGSAPKRRRAARERKA